MKGKELEHRQIREIRAGQRGQRGVYMIELLMAIASSSVIAGAIVSNMAESQRLSNQTENQILAFTVAQEQIDSTRNTPYSSLAACIGEYELKTTQQSQFGSLVPVISPNPLMIDSSKFTGRVYEKIEPGPYVNTLRVTVTIQWTEGHSARNFALSTIVAKNGINNSGLVSGT